MVDVFCGVLSGSTFGTNIKHWQGDDERIADLVTKLFVFFFLGGGGGGGAKKEFKMIRLISWSRQECGYFSPAFFFTGSLFRSYKSKSVCGRI